MKLCQLEFQSFHIESSVRFVEAVLGWKMVPVSIQDQVIIEVPEESPYGISIRAITKNAGNPTGLLAYFESAKRLTELREIILSEGGQILSEPKVVTGYGQVMVAEDPGGIRLGFYEAKFEGPPPRS